MADDISATDIISMGLGAGASVSPWGAAISAIPSIFKLGAGLFQTADARKMAKNLKRPVYNPAEYQIPPEVSEYLNMTKNRIVNPNLPGQGLMEDKLSAITGNAASQITNPNQISDVYGKQMDAQSNLDISAAQSYLGQQQQKETDVASALQYSKAAKDTKFGHDLNRHDKMFDYNQNQPYQERAAAIQALRGSGNKNIYGGLDDLSLLGSSLFMGKNKRKSSGGGGVTNKEWLLNNTDSDGNIWDAESNTIIGNS